MVADSARKLHEMQNLVDQALSSWFGGGSPKKPDEKVQVVTSSCTSKLVHLFNSAFDIRAVAPLPFLSLKVELISTFAMLTTN